MNFQKLIRSFYRMLFSNEFILDDKKMRKNIYGSGWERHIRACPKTSKILHDHSLEIFNKMQ